MITGKEPTTPIPLLFPLLFWLIGLSIGFLLRVETLEFSSLLIISLSVSALLAIALLFKQNRFRLLLVLTAVLLVSTVRTIQYRILPANHLSRYLKSNESTIQEVEFTVTDRPDLQKKRFTSRYRFKGDLIRVGEHKVSGSAFIYVPETFYTGDWADISVGSTGSAVARITKRSSREFSRVSASYFSGRNHPKLFVHPQGLVEFSSKRTKESLFSSGREFVGTIRQEIKEKIDNRFSERESTFVKAILLGVREDNEELRELLAKGGMAHLIAISGLHIGLISLLMLNLFKTIGLRRVLAGVLLILFFIFYGELCGWVPSVRRAVVMLSLLAVSRMLQRKPCYNNILAASLIIITAVDPAQIFSIGLQLSFISVFVLINVIPRFRNKIQLKRGRVERRKRLSLRNTINSRVMDILIASLFISIFIIPITLYYFNRFSLNGVLGNIVGIPLMGLIMPLAIIIIILPQSIWLVTLYHNSFALLFSLFNRWISFSANLPLFFDFVPFEWYHLIVSYILLLSLFLPSALPLKNNSRVKMITKQQRLTGMRRKLISVSAFLILLTLIVVPLWQKNHLKIVFFDVGDADLFLVRTPEKENILIDTGPIEATGKHFQNSALPYFRQQGIKTLDWVIVTHAHSDHYGGLAYVNQELRIKKLMISEHFLMNPVWEQIAAQLDFSGTELIVVQDTMTVELADLRMRLLHPDRDFQAVSENDASLVVKFEIGYFSALFTGDIEFQSEMYLVNNRARELQSRLLKVPHHGSNTSSAPFFIETVNPDIAIISASGSSRFGFPHPSVLKTLHQMEIETFQTAEYGTIFLKTNGLTLKLSNARGDIEFISTLAPR